MVKQCLYQQTTQLCILSFCSAAGIATAGCRGCGHKLTETEWIEPAYRIRTLHSDENSYAELTPLSLVVDTSMFRVEDRNVNKLLFYSSRSNTPSSVFVCVCVCGVCVCVCVWCVCGVCMCVCGVCGVCVWVVCVVCVCVCVVCVCVGGVWCVSVCVCVCGYLSGLDTF
jgi:hypothetical protein